MALRLYNTLGRQKQDFKPIAEGFVGFYSCGPTVYNYAHIGNLRTYIFTDILKRVLKYNGYNVKHVMNITDVGHLTDDSDSGEDKMEKGAIREGKTVWDVAEFYMKAFKSDILKLNILEPTHFPRATDTINEMIEIVKTLESKGFTYISGGNVYFDTSKFKFYNELGLLKLDDQEAGARTEIDENKKNPRDFVLWFGLGSSKFGDKHSMKWESPWGIGYPGWHIECSAMSSKFLGDHFDIHTGGIDHVQVHHTNEIAQSECAFGKHPWVNYWLHANFLVINKGKMAKSGDNFLRLGLVEEKGYDPMEYRYFCLGAHYRSELSFSWEALDGAKMAYNRLKGKIIELKSKITNVEEKESSRALELKKEFLEAINDDLNIPVALAKFLEVLNDNEISSNEKYNTLILFDSVLGLDIINMKDEKIEIPAEINEILKTRENARTSRDWKKSDELRDLLREKGYLVLDSKEGQSVKKI